MKSKNIIFGSLLIAGAGAYYLLLKNKIRSNHDKIITGSDGKETGVNHIRQVFHKSKELHTQSVL